MTNKMTSETTEFPPITEQDIYEHRNMAGTHYSLTPAQQDKINSIMCNVSPYTKVSNSYRTDFMSDLDSINPNTLPNDSNEFICGEPAVFIKESVSADDSSYKNMNNRGLVYFSSEGERSFTNPEGISGFYNGEFFSRIIKSIMFFFFILVFIGLTFMPFFMAGESF